MSPALTAVLLWGSLLMAETPFHDRFANGLQPAWHVLAGQPETRQEAAGPFLRLHSGSVVMLQGEPPRQDFTLQARVRFAEQRPWIEAPFLLRASADGGTALQIYLEQTASQVMAHRFGPDSGNVATGPSPVPLLLDHWYEVRMVALGPRLLVYVDGQLALAVNDTAPRAGLVGLRVGDAVTDYADLVLRDLTAAERAAVAAVRFAGKAVPQTVRHGLKLRDGEVTLCCPDLAEPLRTFEVSLETTLAGPWSVAAQGREVPLSAAQPAHLTLGGPQGPVAVELRRGGRRVGVVSVALQATTGFEGGPFGALFETCDQTVARDRSYHRWRGHLVACNPTWVRDHVHELKAYKYRERDLDSFIDALLELQHPDGFVYEILTTPEDQHLTFVHEQHRRVDAADHIGWVRLEIEADVEYLLVEGVYAIWQATGDLAALRRRLPHLERALTYDFTDPSRWDAAHGALKRPFTPDTWDFIYGRSDRQRYIDATTPMAILHGDNSGLYAACRQLATLLRAAGQAAKATAWEQRAAELRERVNRLCFNGTFYTHQILLQPVDTGVREETILSLSNAYDINRGLPTHAMAVSILDEYARRRTLRQATHFAEWFSLDPPYPQFGPYPAGQYINGGVASFVAGELAKAALNEGREAYGADILTRVAQKVAADGAIYFLYTPDGKNQGGGPSGWGAAAVHSALLEGLAGIHDETTGFEQVTLSPRFAAAGLDHARACARYGPSGAYVALTYDHDAAARQIRLSLSGSARRGTLRLLLPAGATQAQLSSPAGAAGRVESLEQSRYLVAALPPPGAGGVTELVVTYQ